DRASPSGYVGRFPVPATLPLARPRVGQRHGHHRLDAFGCCATALSLSVPLKRIERNPALQTTQRSALAGDRARSNAAATSTDRWRRDDEGCARDRPWPRRSRPALLTPPRLPAGLRCRVD